MSHQDSASDILVIGAGPAGLAVSACLHRHRLPHTVVEQANEVASRWHRHYDRLHLHSVKRHSTLPGSPWAREAPPYPSRAQVIEYFSRYASEHAVAPRFGVAVERLRRAGERFRVDTSEGPLQPRVVIVATGYNGVPHRPPLPGLATFAGPVLHSSAYRNARPFAGQKVLVVGCGNSGAEIALDLAEQQVDVAMVVRGPVHVVPRDLYGRPTQEVAILLSPLPLALRDALVVPVLNHAVGDLRRWGIVRPAIGPNRMIEEHGRVAMIDIGTIAQVKAGRIRVLPAVERVSAGGVHFASGAMERCDAIVLATGYRTGLADWIDGFEAIADARGRPHRFGRETAIPGLYFVGFNSPPSGALREIAQEAVRLAGPLAHAQRPATAHR